MPITKSAKKALRQDQGRRARNVQRKRKFRDLVKKFRQAVSDKNFDQAKALLPRVYQSLDKAAKTNVIRKNKASRLKSRLTKSLAKT